jgi:hypothetical protein
MMLSIVVGGRPAHHHAKLDFFSVFTCFTIVFRSPAFRDFRQFETRASQNLAFTDNDNFASQLVLTVAVQGRSHPRAAARRHCTGQGQGASTWGAPGHSRNGLRSGWIGQCRKIARQEWSANSASTGGPFYQVAEGEKCLAMGGIAGCHVTLLGWLILCHVSIVLSPFTRGNASLGRTRDKNGHR